MKQIGYLKTVAEMWAQMQDFIEPFADRYGYDMYETPEVKLVLDKNLVSDGLYTTVPGEIGKSTVTIKYIKNEEKMLDIAIHEYTHVVFDMIYDIEEDHPVEFWDFMKRFKRQYKRN